MAGKKSKADLEAIKADVRSLTEAVWALREQVSFNGAAAAAVASGGRKKREIAAGQEETVNLQGTVSVDGATASWAQEIAAADALRNDAEREVRILAAMGHRQRLAILTHLIATPSTVADLVTNLELGTTGAAYHHLNVLQAAGLVAQTTRGVFAVPPHQAGMIVSVLASTHLPDAVVTQNPEA